MRLLTILRVAEFVTRVLPMRAQYALADLGGDLWYRMAPRRRRLVAANLARVCGPPRGRRAPPELKEMVHRAFREHARYWLEILRVPRYRVSHIHRITTVHEWERFEPIFRAGPVVLATAHLGNFEPMGHWLVAQRLRAVAPVEEITPPELFQFLLERRGGNKQGLEAVGLSRAGPRLLAALRRGDHAAIVADRDLDRSGPTVQFFGHPTTMPNGPATLAVLTGARIVTGRCLRLGPDRFEIRGRFVEHRPSGDRRRDVTALTEEITRHLEDYIRERPEQWFGAFEQIWPDLAP